MNAQDLVGKTIQRIDDSHANHWVLYFTDGTSATLAVEMKLYNFLNGQRKAK
jgi:hypothetical protein